MSWEWEESEKPCPCGKGTILVRSGSADWFGSEYHEEMKCRVCCKRFVYAPLRSRPDRPWGWIHRAEHERRQRALKAEERKRERLTARARARYGAALVGVLARYGSRRAVWDRLREAGCTTSLVWSFAAFNRAVRDKGRSTAIREMIDARNKDAVAKLIALPRS